MKRTVSRLLTVLLLSAVVVGASQAASHVKVRHAAKTHIAASACPINGCSGPCPLNGASATASAKPAHEMKNGACPVSDPSQCPASCQRSGTAAVAANVKP